MMRKLAVLTAAVLGLSASPAVAATITVTTTKDVVANDGACSLREAIIAANTDTASGAAPGECPAGTPGANQVTLGSGVYGLTLRPPQGGDQANTGGALDIASTITLVGQGVGETTINGNALDRVLDVSADGSLTARGLSVIGGVAPAGPDATGTTPGGQGGGGGGIRSAGILTLDHVTVAGNQAGIGGHGVAGNAQGDDPGNGGSGGGIESTGPTLTIVDSTIADNHAGAGGGAGGGPQSGGVGGDGGGIAASQGLISITRSTISGNQAGGGGFGGFLGGPAGNGGGLSLVRPILATLTNDTIVGNDAGHAGAGVAPPPAASSDGGALIQSGGAASLTNVTISGNTEQNPFGCCHDIAGDVGMFIRNSALDATCSSGITDGGHNVALSSGGCPGVTADAQPGSTAFALGPLGDNGGPTQTMLPGLGSALIDAVPGSGAGCPSTDQRGVSRPLGAACDAGAVEVRSGAVSAYPRRLRFGRTRVAHTRRLMLTLTYAGGDLPARPGRAGISGRNTRDFKIVANRCRGKTLRNGGRCKLVISFRPAKAGPRVAHVTVMMSPPGMAVTVSLTGTGT